MFTLRPMKKDEWSQVANLIYLSTNTWYEKNLGHGIFTGGPEVCELFCRVYEDLDPDCCLVAVHKTNGMVIGSCFYHPRETHVSLGIMNVHPNYFGDGVASMMLERIIGFAEAQGLPVRLVSSALNLDSFSLYTRHGFSPFATYQDMTVAVPKKGLQLDDEDSDLPLKNVREADLEDVSAMGAVEFAVSGISRERDYCYFLENDMEIWDTLVFENDEGEIDGFLISVNHPASNMPKVFASIDRFHGEEFGSLHSRFVSKPVQNSAWLRCSSVGELAPRPPHALPAKILNSVDTRTYFWQTVEGVAIRWRAIDNGDAPPEHEKSGLIAQHP